MATTTQNIPTMEEMSDNYLAEFESKIAQDSPLNDKSFLRALSDIIASGDAIAYRIFIERALQAFGLTATGSDLDDRGAEYGVPRKPATAAEITAELPGLDGTIVPTDEKFTGDPNGIEYSTVGDVETSGGVAALTLIAKTLGVDGNLTNTDTLTIREQIPGMETVANVTGTIETGADEETDDDYRIRILFEIQSTCGGGNATDYKKWGEEVEGVKRVFPYAGRPISEGDSFPGDRQLYVEVTETIDPDGLAPQNILDAVRDSVNYNQANMEARPPLGITDETLYVLSISRTGFYVEIRGLVVDPAQESALKSDMSFALDSYFRFITPFVDGVDLPQNRNDEITDLSISNIVFDVLVKYGASANGIGFGLAPASFLPSYLLGFGERSKLQAVSYVS
jgi:hypothetical protein